MSNTLEVLKRIVREEYQDIMDGVNIHPNGFRDYTKEKNSDFDEPHSTEKMESVNESHDCCDSCNEGKICCSITEKVNEELMNENSAAAAAAAMAAIQVQNAHGKKIKATSALRSSDPATKRKAVSIFKRLKGKFKKKEDKPVDKVAQYRALTQKNQSDYQRESVNEGKKRYYQQDRVGSAKYTISYHDGKKKHKDGSDFFDIKIFRNKKDLAKFVNTLHKSGYVYGFNESVNEGKLDRIGSQLIKDLDKKYKNQKGTISTFNKIKKDLRKKMPRVSDRVAGSIANQYNDFLLDKDIKPKEKLRLMVLTLKGLGIKESVNEAGMGILTSDQADILQAIVMRNKSKPTRTLLNLALKSGHFKGVDKKELLGYIDGARQFVKYMKSHPMESVKLTKTRIKEIIREEIQTVLTEGTRWSVGIETPGGKIASTYGHWDGYPEHAGKMLKKYYSNSGKVKQLLKLGKQGISSIEKSMKGGKDHSFDNPKKGETVFYGRDRGEKDNFSNTWKNRDVVKFNSGEEYFYIWNVKDKKWYYKSRYSNPQDWKELK